MRPWIAGLLFCVWLVPTFPTFAAEEDVDAALSQLPPQERIMYRRQLLQLTVLRADYSRRSHNSVQSTVCSPRTKLDQCRRHVWANHGDGRHDAHGALMMNSR